MIINDRLIENITKDVLAEYIVESRPKRVGDKIYANRGRKATRLGTRIRQLKNKVAAYGLTSRHYNDEETVMNEYNKVISSFGCGFKVDNVSYITLPRTENGASLGKRYDITITFDNDIIIGSITLIGYGSEDDPLSDFKTDFSLVNNKFTSIEN